uniref:Semaphorin-4A n=1 Tax=Rousettus aegyptiacus TaxID=9407 RepID=A0A7J8BHK9_ROUAE|nr:semaphorin 4A [Rousettus aegyptiacus]
MPASAPPLPGADSAGGLGRLGEGLHCWARELAGGPRLSMAPLAPGPDPWSLLGLFLFRLLLLLPGTAGDGGQGPVPRVKYLAGDGRRPLSLFHQKGLQDFDTLLLSADGGTLYVGARDAVLALDVQDPGVPQLKSMIPWPASDRKKTECAFKKNNETQCFNFIRVLVSLNATHLYVCGTFAFSPACTFIELKDSHLLPISEDKVVEGKGQSPFDPAHKHTAVLVDGTLYSGTMNNFLGSEPILIRTLGPQPVLKTDTFLRWLQPDASFVAAIPSTQVVYFFFEETASEFEFFDKLRTSRVARVCKNDVGGERLLQKKWTTFLKAQLLCTEPGQLPFNVIRHAVLLPGNFSSGPHVYAVFTSQWQVGGTRSSAVCAFSLKDIERAFEGKYKELNKETSRWTTHGVPDDISPRPGSCSAGPSSDKALTFMKAHFLMDEQVVGMPLLVKSGVEYTRLAVEAAQDLDGHSHLVMYLGTTTGALHKAVVSEDGRVHLVEEIQLFPRPEPVLNLQLAPTQGAVFAGFSGGVVRVPRANCSVYESCMDCVLARDPHCAWDPESRICRLLPTPAPRSWRQDVERGSPGWACANGPVGRSLPPQSRPQIIKEVLAVPNSILELPCPHLSALASYHWGQGPAPAPRASSVVYNGSLLLALRDGAGGLYQCWATENGFSYPVVSYWVDSRDQQLALAPDLAGIPRERVEAPLTRVGGGAAPAAQRSYWPHFLVVTTLLALVLSAALILLLVSPLGALRGRGKVQGCGPLPPGEKAPLSREQHLPPPNGHRTMASSVGVDGDRLGTEVV